MEGGGWTEAFFVTLGGPQARDSSGRDDNFVLSIVFRVPQEGSAELQIPRLPATPARGLPARLN